MKQDGYFNHLKNIFGIQKQDGNKMSEEKSKQAELDIIEKEKQLIIPKILRTEFNFLKYPAAIHIFPGFSHQKAVV